MIRRWGADPVFVEHAELPTRREWYAPDVLARIDEMCGLLRSAGVRPRQPVAICLPNSVDFAALFLAAVELGALPSPLKPEYREIELVPILADLAPALVVAETALLAAIEPLLAPGTGVLERDGGTFNLRAPVVPAQGGAAVDEEIASINFTYRGLGYPIGAMIPGDQYLLGAEIFAQGIRGGICRRVAVVLPMSHIFALIGCLFASLSERMTMYLVGTLHPRPLLATVQQHAIDFLVVVPEVAAFLNRFAPRAGDLSCLDTVGSGGSLLTPELFHATQAAFQAEVLHGYGLTEFTPASRNLRSAARPGTIGPPAREIELRIADPDAEGLGEIQLRSPLVSPGYYRRPAESADARTPDGWFRTGDLGYLDDGHLVFVRERKATRKVNGLMVDLEEVRRAVAQAVECDDATLELRDGKLVLSCGAMAADRLPNLTELRRELSARIAPYKLPQVVELRGR